MHKVNIHSWGFFCQSRQGESVRGRGKEEVVDCCLQFAYTFDGCTLRKCCFGCTLSHVTIKWAKESHLPLDVALKSTSQKQLQPKL